MPTSIRPLISVVVPAYNEEVTLPSCLKSLTDQNFKGGYEIIVVDNNSTDLTPEIAKVYGAKVIKESNQGVAYARQAGFMAAKGKIVCTTDADTLVPPDWLDKIFRKFSRDSDLIAIGGGYKFIGLDSIPKAFIAALLPIFFGLEKIFSHGGVLCEANMAIKKTPF